MVISAINRGFECIGFSGHSFVDFDTECGMDAEHAALYYDDISRLKIQYRDRIRIFCGIEQDYFSQTGTERYDYVIGSVHYVPVPYDYSAPGHAAKHELNASPASDAMIAVDNTPEILTEAVRKYFDNDYYALAESYFELVSNVVEKTGADIIGHFDLVSKFNEKCRLFDEHDPAYVSIWQKAADRLLDTGKVFEINTGAISRGWRSVTYPAPEMIDYIKARGGRFILSSDSHCADNIGFGFDVQQ